MITLVPMTEQEYLSFLEHGIREYAADKVRAGNWPAEDALERSRREFERYLPEGIHTPRNFVGKLTNEEGTPVGYLWYAQPDDRPGVAFIYDFEIYAPFRRRGYASQAIETLASHAKARGFTRLELHVFGHNTAARELYKKAGFHETNVQMAMDI